MEEPRVNFEHDVDTTSLGYAIDSLIRANIKNWEGQEIFFDPNAPIAKGNQAMAHSFQANKIRNAMITKINAAVHNGPIFHFRNYHNY